MNRLSATVRGLLMAALLFGVTAPAAAQKTVTISVPSNVNFQVRDISTTTTGAPSPMVVNVVNPTGFANSDKVRILARADAATFTGPGGTASIPAGAVSWTATTNRGNASDGTLSTTYTEVYRSPANFNNATVSLTWSIGPFSAAGVRAGSHTLPVRWRFEVF